MAFFSSVFLKYVVTAGLTEWLPLSRSDKSDYLKDLTRDNVQLIVSELWEQPTERVEESIVAKLPAPSFVLPRMRKCPVPRTLTKWEKFAQEKGIKKTKKAKKVFDEELDVNYQQEQTCRKIGSLNLFVEMGTNLWIPSSRRSKRKGLGLGGSSECWSNGGPVRKKTKPQERKSGEKRDSPHAEHCQGKKGSDAPLRLFGSRCGLLDRCKQKYWFQFELALF